MQTATNRRAWWRSRWWMPLFSLSLGLAILVAFWLGGDLGMGLVGLGVMAGLGALFLLGARTDTLRGLAGPGRDERWAQIDTTATAFAGIVLIGLILGLWLNEIAHGGDGSPYGQLGAVAGLAYVVGVVWQRFRA